MLATRHRDTPGELAIRSAAHRLGLRYLVDQQLPGMRRRADMLFMRAKVAVFSDGCFWHACPLHATWPKSNSGWWRDKIQSNARRDRETDARLAAAGWEVLRFWEHENAALAAKKIAVVVRRRSAQQ